MKPIAYTLDHVDTDLHVSFPLVLAAPIRPSPIVVVANQARVSHGIGAAQYINHPHYPRILLKGDWT